MDKMKIAENVLGAISALVICAKAIYKFVSYVIKLRKTKTATADA